MDAMGQKLGMELQLEPGQVAAEPNNPDRAIEAADGGGAGARSADACSADALAAEQLLTRISLEAEVPEVLFDGMREFIRSHPQWDQYRLITAALASFLFQNGSRDACVAQHYLNGVVMR
jgi:hypothetical protein